MNGIIASILKEAIWIRISATINYFKKKTDDLFIFYSSKKWKLCTVKRVANERWNVVIYKAHGEVVKYVKENYEKLKPLLDQSTASYYVDEPEKKIEWFSKYQEDNPIFIKAEQILSNEQLFDFLVAKLKLHSEVFEKFFGFIPKETLRTKQFKYGNWDIFFDTNTNKSINDFTNLLDEVEKFMSDKELKFLCYGKVFAIDSLASQALADYLDSNDTLRIGFKDTKKNSGIESISKISHELGHRYWKKFAANDFKLAVHTKFDEVRHKIPQFPEGSEVTKVDDGSKFTVDGKKFTRNLFYLLKLKEKGEKTSQKYEIGQVYQVPVELMGVGFVGTETTDDRRSFLPRSYSLKSVEEFFCVLMEHWIKNSIQEPAKTWFEGLFKGA